MGGFFLVRGFGKWRGRDCRRRVAGEEWIGVCGWVIDDSDFGGMGVDFLLWWVCFSVIGFGWMYVVFDKDEEWIFNRRLRRGETFV